MQSTYDTIDYAVKKLDEISETLGVDSRQLIQEAYNEMLSILDE